MQVPGALLAEYYGEWLAVWPTSRVPGLVWVTPVIELYQGSRLSAGASRRLAEQGGDIVDDVAEVTRGIPRDPGDGTRNAAPGDAELTAELREVLLRRGASLVGFGHPSRMEGAPDIQRPDRYLADVKSMISIALHVNEGCCDHVAQRNVASWRSYQIFALGIINPSLDRLSLEASTFLEDRGYIVYPFPANAPHDFRPTPEYPGGLGDISHTHVAVACGLGELGWHSMLMTPEFGTRHKLTTLLTTAPVVPDPMAPQGQLCNPEACGYQCARACPTAAIPKAATPDTTRDVNMHGMWLKYGKLVGWRCRWGCSGMLKATGGNKNIPIPAQEPTAEELLEYKAQMDVWQLREQTKSYAGLVPYCGKCLGVCPVKRGEHPFKEGTAGGGR